MRGLRHPYRWGRDHPLVVDTLFALAIATFGVLTELFNPETEAADYIRDTDALSIVLVLVGTVPLALRRRFPLSVYLVICAVGTLYYVRGYGGGGPLIAILVGLYSVAAHSPRRDIWVLIGTVVAQVGGTLLDPDADDPVVTTLMVAGMMGAAWVFGDNIRVRRAYVKAVEDRAEQLEREQDAQARRAVLEERSRIARELHDIVAHSMSVMVVQAGAARRTLDRDPARAVESMSHIESTGRDALAEMRRVVAVLRSDGDRDRERDRDRDHERGDPVDLPRGEPFDRDALLPQPGLDELTTLVEQCREAGLPVELEVDGEVRSLPSGLELAVYRIVQEALTNTMRHAGPARAHVRLCFGEDGVTVSVVDDGRGASATADSGPGSHGDGTDEARHAGHGLAGMHERVGLYGGRLTAGPRAGGGFSVQAEIPLSDDAATKPRPAGPSRLLTGWWAS